MYVAGLTQIKIVDFIKKCGEKERLLMLVLKNLEEFNPEYIEMENKLKNSSLAQKIEFKIYSYNFSQPKEVEHVAKYIEYEQPDIILILSNSSIEGVNRKLFESLHDKGEILIVKIGQFKNKLNGDGLDSIYDAVFSNIDETIEFFEKACALVKPKRKTSVVQISSVDDFFKNLPSFSQIEEEKKQQEIKQEKKEERKQSSEEITDVNILLLIEVLKDLRESIEELKEKLDEDKNSQKKEVKVEKKERTSSANYNILNVLTVALLLILIGIILVYK